jgi:hypothetical protein
MRGAEVRDDPAIDVIQMPWGRVAGAANDTSDSNGSVAGRSWPVRSGCRPTPRSNCRGYLAEGDGESNVARLVGGDLVMAAA